ncbi:MAG TPA: type II CAAX endopeptidase family protein, partial [Gemmatimonadaceae bacterium]|nr:type II CAAX endopeptidase family protein [Gemmatimonadaceae bacterium]
GRALVLDPRTLVLDPHGALRTPWRLAVFVAAVAVSLVVVNAVVVPLVAGVAWFAAGQRLELAWWAFLAAVLLAHVVSFRFAGGDWTAVRLGRAAARPRAVLTGVAIGVVAIGVPALLLLAVGWLRAQPAAPGSSLAAGARLLVALAPAALGEELLVRGYAFAALRHGAGDGWAVALTSVAFGLLHLQNEGANLQAVGQVVFAGVWLCGVLLATESLYAAWAAHLGWNWVMAAVLHAPVSGLTFAVPDFRVIDAGPDWATGGAWGPEGGLGATLGMALTLTFLFARRTRREEPRAWPTASR